MPLSHIEKSKADMKWLEKKVKEDRTIQPWDKPHNPAYAKFLSEVGAVVPPDHGIPPKALFGLWFRSKGFQDLWTKKVVKADRSDQELALFIRFVHRGLDDNQGLMLLYAWWKRHRQKHSEAKLNYLTTKAIPRAREFAAKIIEDRRKKQERDRQRESSRRPSSASCRFSLWHHPVRRRSPPRSVNPSPASRCSFPG